MRPSRVARAASGLTLVELLVAVLVLAIMAALAWRGLDGLRTQHQQLQSRSDELHALQTVLAQWQIDHQKMSPGPDRIAWDWNGRVLRITRTALNPADGWQVVAWRWRAGTASGSDAGALYRWQSPPLSQRQTWQQAWDAAQTWSQTPTAELHARETRLLGAQGWQLWVHRGGSWVNPLSSAADPTAKASASTPAPLPQAVRLRLDREGSPSAPGLWVVDTLLSVTSQATP